MCTGACMMRDLNEKENKKGYIHWRPQVKRGFFFLNYYLSKLLQIFAGN